MKILDILEQCTINGKMIKLPKMVLELETEYKPVRKLMEIAGGKWIAGINEGFLFQCDPTPVLKDLISKTERQVKTKNKSLIKQDEMNFNNAPAKISGESEPVRSELDITVFQYSLI